MIRDTSLAAARSIAGHSAHQRAQVLGLIMSAGPAGMTREEIEERSTLSGNAVRPRCVELIASGLVRATDATRPTKSGRQAEVLVAVEVKP